MGLKIGFSRLKSVKPIFQDLRGGFSNLKLNFHPSDFGVKVGVVFKSLYLLNKQPVILKIFPDLGNSFKVCFSRNKGEG